MEKAKEVAVMQYVEQTLEFLQKNSGVLILAVCVLLFGAMLQYLRQSRKIQKKLDAVNENMTFHFEQMMDQEEQIEAEKATERKREREAYQAAVKQKEKKEQEAVFDAVLQEIFP